MSCYDCMLDPSLRILDPTEMHLTKVVSPAPTGCLRRGGRS